jgi:PKD repeat protein
MAYYIKDTGTETFPYDTEEKAALSLNRLVKQLQGYELTSINTIVTGTSYDVTFNSAKISPFPILDQAVAISCTITQKNLTTYEYSPGYYMVTPGTTFGATSFYLGNYSFVTTSSSSLLPSNPVIPYTCQILKGASVLATFPKFTSGVSRVYTFLVKATAIEFYVDDVLYATDSHSITNWVGLYALGNPPRIAIYETNPTPDGTLVVSEEVGSLGRNYNTDFTITDVIDIASTIVEPTVSNSDMMPNGTLFNGAIIQSYGSQKIWSLKSEYFTGLSPQNLDIEGINQTAYQSFINPLKDIYDNIFRNFSDPIYIDGNCTESIDIRNNIFTGSTDTSSITVSSTIVPIDIYKNIFDGDMYLMIDNCPGVTKVFNNVFMNNSISFTCMDIEYYSEIMNVNVINNTFYSMGVGTYAVYVYADDSSGYIESFLIFNNIVDSGLGFYLDLYIENPDNIHTFIHSNNNSSGYEYSNNGDPIALDPTEITADPQFEGVSPYPLRLLNTSPSYATGLVNTNTPVDDFIGVLRKSTPDMGAYETESLTPIVPDFSADITTGPANLTVAFTDLTTGEPTSWDWDFGDGTSHSTSQNPTHIYELAGIYSVSLTSANESSSDSITKVDYITVNLVADFSGTPLTGNIPLTVAFTDLTVGGATSWDWDFGDGSLHSTDQNPTHVYTVSGVYTVTFTSTSGSLSDTEIKSSYITASEVVSVIADFYADAVEVLVNTPINFFDTSTGDPIDWSWFFGDNSSILHIQNPVHSYASSGYYTVTLTAYNESTQGTKFKEFYITVTLEHSGTGFVREQGPTLIFD